MQRRPTEGVAATLTGTKLKIAEAALETLKQRGFAGASAREIAGAGGFNQALIFYHFGSVQNALLAALDLVSARRMEAYGPAFERARTMPELASLARADLRRGSRERIRHGARRDGRRRRLGRRAGRRGGCPFAAVDRDGRGQAARAARGIAARVDDPRAATWRSRSSRCTWASTCSATSKASTPARSRCSSSASATRRSRRAAAFATGRRVEMSTDTGLDLVTGAFSYSGSRIAERLLDAGRGVRTLTFHPDRPHPLRGRVEPLPYRFDDQVALAESLEGVSTLYNTYWVRFDHGRATFENAIANSRALFCAAKRAGVARIVHVSIANPVTRVGTSLLQGQGAGRAGARGGRRAVLDRPPDAGVRRRSRCPGEQHRLDSATHAGLRAPRERRLPGPAGARR